MLYPSNVPYSEMSHEDMMLQYGKNLIEQQRSELDAMTRLHQLRHLAIVDATILTLLRNDKYDVVVDTYGYEIYSEYIDQAYAKEFKLVAPGTSAHEELLSKYQFDKFLRDCVPKGAAVPRDRGFATIPTDGEVRTTSATGGEKGMKPARYDLIPVGPLEILAKLYGKGAEKYDEHNWRQGYELSKSYAALQRHANQFWSGEDDDPEMGLSHMASVAFHAFAIIEILAMHPQYDDRFKVI